MGVVKMAWGCALGLLLLGARAATANETVASGGATVEDALEKALDQLASQIRTVAERSERRNIAVAPMVRLGGGVSELGAYLADKLTNRLSESESFEVVDRLHLNTAIHELKFSYTHLVNPDKAKVLGRFVGADGIVTGQITDLDQSFDITLRLLDTESMAVLAAAEAKLPHSATIVRLWEANLAEEQLSSTPAPETGGKSSKAPSGVLFDEDFSKVPSGELPPGWSGSGWVVSADTDGHQCLRVFQSPSEQIKMPYLALPNRFILDVDVRWGGILHVTMNKLEIALRAANGHVRVNGQLVRSGPAISSKQSRRVRLVRNGFATELWLDDEQLHVGRYDLGPIGAIRYSSKATAVAIRRVTVTQP